MNFAITPSTTRKMTSSTMNVPFGTMKFESTPKSSRKHGSGYFL